MKKSKYSKITISMDKSLAAAIQQQAEKEFLSVSAFLRLAASDYLKGKGEVSHDSNRTTEGGTAAANAL